MFVCAASAAGDHRFPLEFKTLPGNLMHLGAITVVRWSKKKKRKKLNLAKQPPLVFLKEGGISVGRCGGGGVWGLTLKMLPLGIFFFLPPPHEVLGGESLLESSTDGKMS